MKTSCLRLKLVELNFLVSFNTDDQSKTDVANTVNVIIYSHLDLNLEYFKIEVFVHCVKMLNFMPFSVPNYQK